MITLAGVRYRAILADEGGPVARIETTDVLLEGLRAFQANAFLRDDLTMARRKRRQVYGEASGSGTHTSPLVARCMAISEAMERWAYASTALSADRARYAFDVDPMSNGMAAFPGWRARQARGAALNEAVERHTLIAWWEGAIPAVERTTEWPGVGAVVLGHDPRHVTVIVHKRTDDGLHAYGHATAASFETACRKALVELMRHEHVVRCYRVSRSLAGGGTATVSDLLERRSLFFASEEGHQEFLQRLHTPARGPAPERRTAFDGPIVGPWSRYADVWRVVFHPVSMRYLSDTERYFLW